MTVRLRFAPSPTGYLHIGGARTALFNWMYAHKHNGQFILRIEDTDQKRFVPGATADIIHSLRWLGLNWDEGPDIGGPFGPYVQSERTDLYRHWAYWLVEQGLAYKSFTTSAELETLRAYQIAHKLPIGYDNRDRDLTPAQIAEKEAAGIPFTIRFKAPLEGSTTVLDAIRGEVVFDNQQIADQILLKADGYPTYHLANVVDDHFMRITHICRADEWLSTAPLHVNLYAAFGWELPQYAHLPVILSPSGKGKLSKRDQAFQEGNIQVLVTVREYEQNGYLPHAILNFLANVGWSYGNDVEKFLMEDAIPRFTLEAVNPAPTNLPYSKLEWLNGQYIQEMSALELAQAVRPFLEKADFEVNLDALLVVMPAMKVRLKRLTEAVEFLRFLFDDDAWQPDATKLVGKSLERDAALAGLEQARDLVRDADTLTLETLETGLRAIGERVAGGHAGPFLGMLRYAVTSQDISPPLFESILALGRARTLTRLERLIPLLAG